MTQSDVESVRPYLSAEELLAVSIPEVRRGGYDVPIVDEVLSRAATTIREYAKACEKMSSERQEHIAKIDELSRADDAAVATRLLTAANATVDALVAEGHAEAARIVEAAKTATADLRAETDRAREAMATELALAKQAVTDDLAAFTARTDAARAAAQRTIDTWQSSLSERGQQIIEAAHGVIALVTGALAASAPAAAVSEAPRVTGDSPTNSGPPAPEATVPPFDVTAMPAPEAAVPPFDVTAMPAPEAAAPAPVAPPPAVSPFDATARPAPEDAPPFAPTTPSPAYGVSEMPAADLSAPDLSRYAPPASDHRLVETPPPPTGEPIVFYQSQES